MNFSHENSIKFIILFKYFQKKCVLKKILMTYLVNVSTSKQPLILDYSNGLIKPNISIFFSENNDEYFKNGFVKMYIILIR